MYREHSGLLPSAVAALIQITPPAQAGASAGPCLMPCAIARSPFRSAMLLLEPRRHVQAFHELMIRPRSTMRERRRESPKVIELYAR